MTRHYRAIVIGGGVVGCSVLYHLAKHGWADVALLERDELTSGSTWHAAGGMHTINGDPNVARLQQYTIELYKEIEELSGQATGVHLTGGVMLAATQARMEFLRGLIAKGRYLGIELEEISPVEALDIMPLIDPKQFVGAVRTVVDGHLDPSGVTHAYAKSARKLGAEVHRHTKVEDLVQREDGVWRVITNSGEFTAEHVVNAGGLWAREVGRMAGLELPVLAMEHMYLITEDMPEVAAWNTKTGTEIGHAIDFDGELYLRQERGGMLMGTYERAGKPWSPTQTPWDFGHELLEPDIDRIAPSLEVGFEHFPAFQKTGIKQIINGPFTFAPDGNPLVGPVRGLRGFWCACGVMAGFSQGGGVGLTLSNWMIDGDPGGDVWAMDVARYGEWASLAFTNKKVRENYSRRFSIRFPNEELPAGRPLRTTPLYDRHIALGAQMGASYGLEVPLWYAPEGVKDVFSWRRSTDFEHVGAEARAVREGAGIMDISGFAKFAVKGKNARGWLDRIFAGRIPGTGRMALAPMLNDKGKLIGDFTIACNDDHDFFLAGSGIAEEYYLRWFDQHAEEGVTVENLGLGVCGLSIAGPKSRDLLAKVTWQDVSADVFKFMGYKPLEIGMAPCHVGRVTYTGDLGYEIWMKADYVRHVFDTLMEAGAEFGVKPFGLRALNALRLEKNWAGWAREYRPVYGPVDAGLDRFIAWNKNADFIGREAALAERESGGKLRLIALKLNAQDADAIGDEPVSHDGKVVGWITSGGYAHGQGQSMALAYVPKELAENESGWSVELLGQHLPAALQAEPLFDPNGERMRG